MLGGERHSGDIHVPTLLQPPRPLTFGVRLLVDDTQICAGTMHEKCSQIAIALARDLPELVFAATRVLPWSDPQPGGKAFVSFLVDVRGMREVAAEWPRIATYHDACSGLRELSVREQPRRLLASVSGLELRELPGSEVCCGFGGTFCVKYPDVSDKMVSDKADDIAATGAQAVLCGDLGCLLNIAGKLSRQGRSVEARHVAEVLAGMTGGTPPIGAPRQR